MTDKELLDLLESRMTLWRKVLGIDPKWNVNITIVDHPNNDPTMDAGVRMDHVYFNASIEFSRIGDDDRIEEGILHETLHIALAPLRQALDYLIQMIPESQREFAETVADNGMEQSIQGMCRGTLIPELVKGEK